MSLWLALAVLAGAGVAAFHNSFSVPLLFDDMYAVVNNRSIRDPRDLGAVFAPANDISTAGRPLLNLSFALNYAQGEMSVRGYHVVNLVLHVAAAWSLFGLLREVFRSPRVAARVRGEADWLALALAFVWAVHPLQTASVTYISQRAEVLMALFYLLTLFFAARGAARPREEIWPWLAVGACTLGMLSKETMATAPVVLLLLDRAFFAPTWRHAFRRCWWLYPALALTWVILGCLIFQTQIGARGVGYETEVSAWTYALTQAKVIWHYARLAFWPAPLVLDYGPEVLVRSVGEALPWALGHLAVWAVMIWLFLRRHFQTGVVLACFYLLLAPTSSVVPIAFQPMAENRMYLPLAVILAAAGAGLVHALGRRGLVLLVSLALASGLLAVRRNRDFSSAVAIWSDTVRKRPENTRAHNQLAAAYLFRGDRAGAKRESEKALALDPEDSTAHNNLGMLLGDSPATLSQAIAHYEAAARRTPRSAPIQANLGGALMRTAGRQAEAERHLREAIRVDPNYAEGHLLLGNLLLATRAEPAGAFACYVETLRLDPKNVNAHIGLGIALNNLGRPADAARALSAAVALSPKNPLAHLNLGNAMLRIPGRLPDAIAEYRRALELQPDYADAWSNLGVALLSVPERKSEALAALSEALRLQPGHTAAREALQRAQAADKPAP